MNTSGFISNRFEPVPTGFSPGGALTRSQSECVSFVHQKSAFNEADGTASSANVAYKLSKCKQAMSFYQRPLDDTSILLLFLLSPKI